MGSRLLSLWYQMTLKKKLSIIIGSVSMIMGASIFLNLEVVYTFVDDARVIMDDNLACYQLQDAMEKEHELFSKFISNKTSENRSALYSACQETKNHINQLPYDYETIGEMRFGVTWNLINGYETYEKQRDKVISMRSGDANYIKELYKTYDMQEYLEAYVGRLTELVLTSGNDYYQVKALALQKMPYFIIAISLTGIGVLVVTLRFLTGNIVSTMIQLATVSEKIEKNDFSSPDVHWDGSDELGRLVSAFNKMKLSTKNYVVASEGKRQVEEKLYRQEMERADLEKRFSMAQLQLIKSQLNPHFLFNTLNMMTRMAQMEEAPVTEEMLVAVGNLLRYSLRTSNPFAPLEQELKVVKDYMYIQQMRFNDRLQWNITCDKDLYQEEIPVFLLQPLVENAVIHGISEKETGGSIHIDMKRSGENLWISVADTGKGMKQEKLKEIRNAMETEGTGLGIGLGNIYRRISAYYEYGKVMINSSETIGTIVEIEFGKRKGENTE